MQESFETGESYNSGQAKALEKQRIDEKLLERLVESESGEDEKPEGQPGLLKNKKVAKMSRLSSLSKLNLLGLIDLALIACNLKQSKNVEAAILRCEDSILILKELNSDNEGKIGIAAQNLIEELLTSLLQIKELNVVEEVSNDSSSNNKASSTSPSKVDSAHFQNL